MTMNKDYNEHDIDKITKIQSICRGFISRKNIYENIMLIKFKILSEKYLHNDFFIKCFTISKKYNPAKNEYKFIYGGLIQKCMINLLNKLFYSCVDLDQQHSHGAEYKVDCKLNITKSTSFKLSIKAKKNKNGKIIIINKFRNNRYYSLNNLITIIVILETKDIIIIPRKYIDDIYIEDNDSNISFKSSLITNLYKKNSEFIIHLCQNEKFIKFYEDEYPNIKLHDIYSELYSKL